VYLVDEEAVVDFVKSLGEIHNEHVRLKAFLEVLGEIVDKLDQLAQSKCYTYLQKRTKVSRRKLPPNLTYLGLLQDNGTRVGEQHYATRRG
jgi:hypothetical protein